MRENGKWALSTYLFLRMGNFGHYTIIYFHFEDGSIDAQTNFYETLSL